MPCYTKMATHFCSSRSWQQKNKGVFQFFACCFKLWKWHRYTFLIERKGKKQITSQTPLRLVKWLFILHDKIQRHFEKKVKKKKFQQQSQNCAPFLKQRWSITRNPFKHHHKYSTLIGCCGVSMLIDFSWSLSRLSCGDFRKIWLRRSCVAVECVTLRLIK